MSIIVVTSPNPKPEAHAAKLKREVLYPVQSLKPKPESLNPKACGSGDDHTVLAGAFARDWTTCTLDPVWASVELNQGIFRAMWSRVWDLGLENGESKWKRTWNKKWKLGLERDS